MRRSLRKQLQRAAARIDCRIIGLAAVRALAGSGTDVEPKWVQYFPKGVHHRADFPGGKAEIDDAFCATVLANWKAAGSPELPVDYFHRGESDDGVTPNAEKVASGWIGQLEARGDGVWGLTKWTEAARARILADELRHVSPTWHPNALNPRTGTRQGPTLLGAALLNDPFFQQLPRVAAAAAVPPVPATPESLAMNREQLNAALALAGITLAATATDAECGAALTTHLAAAAKVRKDSDEALRAKSAGEEALRAQMAAQAGDLATIKASNTALQGRLDAADKAKREAGIVDLQARLVRDGRIVASAQESVKDYAEKLGLEAAEKFFGSFSPAVPLAPVGHDGAGPALPADRQALQAKFDSELDASIKAGKSAAVAAKELNRKPEFAALFSRALRN